MNIKYFALGLALGGTFFLGVLTSCNDLTMEEGKAVSFAGQSTTQGDASVRIFVPDYNAMAETNARIIMPGTSKIRLSYYDRNISEWVIHGTIADLEKENSEEISDGNGLIGRVYDVVFADVPASIYAKGELKLELMDSNFEILSVATNSEAVTIIDGECSEPIFYSLPLNVKMTDLDRYNRLWGEFAKGELKVIMITGSHDYTFRLTVGESDTYPDIILFDVYGKFRSYHSVNSEEESSISLSLTGTYYVGIYAKDAVSEVRLQISYTNTIGFGTSTTFSDDWIRSKDLGAGGAYINLVAGAAPDGLASAAEFNYKAPGNGGSLKRTIYVDTSSAVFSFKLKTDISESLEFYIDDTRQFSVTGKKDWFAYNLNVNRGSHTIKWRVVKPNPSYVVDGVVYLADIILTDESYDLSEGFGTGTIFNPSWETLGDISYISLVARAAPDGSSPAVKFYYNDMPMGDTVRLRRDVKVATDSILSFKLKSDVLYWTGSNPGYIGKIEFYLDGVQQLSTKSTGNAWREYRIPVSPGNHLLEWRATKLLGVFGSSSDSGFTVYLADVALSDRGNLSITVTTPEYSDIGLTYTQDGAILTLTATDSYTNYSWRVDGSVVEGVGSNIMTLDTTGWQKGLYEVTVEAEKDGSYYSATAYITIGDN